MAKLVQPVKWHGGKHYLAERIIDLMPPHLHYVEPYFGGGSVLLRRDPQRDWLGENQKSHHKGCSEVVNDINNELVDFFRVLRDPKLFPEFERQIRCVPFSQVEWVAASQVDESYGQLERALAFFVLARQSRQGLMRDFATLSRNRTRRGRNEQVSSYFSAINGLADVHERLSRVVILNEDACKVIRQQDGQYTHFYCDPPYLHETRVATDAYAHEMTKAQHQELLDTLSGIKGTFQLSGYHSKVYDDFAATHGWRCDEFHIDNKASSAKTKQLKCECVWMNY